jgi:hypothetical protein
MTKALISMVFTDVTILRMWVFINSTKVNENLTRKIYLTIWSSSESLSATRQAAQQCNNPHTSATYTCGQNTDQHYILRL